jgi:hypothetical protein
LLECGPYTSNYVATSRWGYIPRFQHRKTEDPGFQMKTKKIPIEPN